MTTTGDVTVLRSFTGESEAANPAAPLMQASDGRLYGTSKAGGPFDGGTVFRVSSVGESAVVHAFGPDFAPPPTTPVIQASNGDFYGTRGFGAFRLSPEGIETTFMFPNALFTSTTASLLQASDGQLYGTIPIGYGCLRDDSGRAVFDGAYVQRQRGTAVSPN